MGWGWGWDGSDQEAPGGPRQDGARRPKMEARGAAKMGARRPRDKGKGNPLAPSGRVKPPGGTPKTEDHSKIERNQKDLISAPPFLAVWGPKVDSEGGPK